jgi:dTDP-L-rhamnose 4-epimerase
MSEHILITGGAGFIGSHVADELLRHGHRVRVLDNLEREVHGSFDGGRGSAGAGPFDVGRGSAGAGPSDAARGAASRRPAYLSPDVELIVGDVRDRETVRGALRGVSAVYHFAAKVGVGQSMYQIEEYTSANALGTAVLLSLLIERPVRRLIVASSMSVYGEGLYRTARGSVVEGRSRSLAQLRRGSFEVQSAAGEAFLPMPTPETKSPALDSVYALSKYHQEQLCLITGRAYGIPTVALRFFNVYGPRQALSNPYTGVLAIFAAQLLNGAPPMIFEDGLQKRDFVSVHDVARASVRALVQDDAVGLAINIGSGRAVTVREVAARIRRAVGSLIEPEITGKYRMGDVRHCFADITRARHALGYEPEISLEDGLRELASWLAGQAAKSRVAEARAELDARGLTL